MFKTTLALLFVALVSSQAVRFVNNNSGFDMSQSGAVAFNRPGPFGRYTDAPTTFNGLRSFPDLNVYPTTSTPVNVAGTFAATPNSIPGTPAGTTTGTFTANATISAQNGINGTNQPITNFTGNNTINGASTFNGPTGVFPGTVTQGPAGSITINSPANAGPNAGANGAVTFTGNGAFNPITGVALTNGLSSLGPAGTFYTNGAPTNFAGLNGTILTRDGTTIVNRGTNRPNGQPLNGLPLLNTTNVTLNPVDTFSQTAYVCIRDNCTAANSVVCATNNVTYRNLCQLECFGAVYSREGACF